MTALCRVTASATLGAIVQRSGLAGAVKPLRLTPVNGSWMDVASLGPAGFDYTGDGAPNTDALAFDAALNDAVSAFDFKACYVPDQIRVVIMTRMAMGAKNGNCETFDPFLWAKDVPGKTMFITGGVHVDTRAASATAHPAH